MNWVKKVICVLSLLLLTSPAYALTISFGDRTSWDAAMSSQTTLDFTGFSSGGTSSTYHQYFMPITYNGVGFSAPSGSVRLFGISPTLGYDAPYHTTEYLSWDTSSSLVDSTLITTLPGSVSGIAFDYGAFYGGNIPFTITLGNGDSFSANSASNAYSFFGITTDTPFSSFSISAGSVITDWAAIDNLSYGTDSTSGSIGGGTSSVPEPSTLLLLGSGMVGLGLTRLRKFRKNA